MATAPDQSMIPPTESTLPSACGWGDARSGRRRRSLVQPLFRGSEGGTRAEMRRLPRDPPVHRGCRRLARAAQAPEIIAPELTLRFCSATWATTARERVRRSGRQEELYVAPSMLVQLR